MSFQRSLPENYCPYNRISLLAIRRIVDKFETVRDNYSWIMAGFLSSRLERRNLAVRSPPGQVVYI